MTESNNEYITRRKMKFFKVFRSWVWVYLRAEKGYWEDQDGDIVHFAVMSVTGETGKLIAIGKHMFGLIKL